MTSECRFFSPAARRAVEFSKAVVEMASNEERLHNAARLLSLGKESTTEDGKMLATLSAGVEGQRCADLHGMLTRFDEERSCCAREKSAIEMLMSMQEKMRRKDGPRDELPSTEKYMQRAVEANRSLASVQEELKKKEEEVRNLQRRLSALEAQNQSLLRLGLQEERVAPTPGGMTETDVANATLFALMAGHAATEMHYAPVSSALFTHTVGGGDILLWSEMMNGMLPFMRGGHNFSTLAFLSILRELENVIDMSDFTTRTLYEAMRPETEEVGGLGLPGKLVTAFRHYLTDGDVDILSLELRSQRMKEMARLREIYRHDLRLTEMDILSITPEDLKVVATLALRVAAASSFSSEMRAKEVVNAIDIVWDIITSNRTCDPSALPAMCWMVPPPNVDTAKLPRYMRLAHNVACKFYVYMKNLGVSMWDFSCDLPGEDYGDKAIGLLYECGFMVVGSTIRLAFYSGAINLTELRTFIFADLADPIMTPIPVPTQSQHEENVAAWVRYMKAAALAGSEGEGRLCLALHASKTDQEFVPNRATEIKVEGDASLVAERVKMAKELVHFGGQQHLMMPRVCRIDDVGETYMLPPVLDIAIAGILRMPNPHRRVEMGLNSMAHAQRRDEMPLRWYRKNLVRLHDAVKTNSARLLSEGVMEEAKLAENMKTIREALTTLDCAIDGPLCMLDRPDHRVFVDDVRVAFLPLSTQPWPMDFVRTILMSRWGVGLHDTTPEKITQYVHGMSIHLSVAPIRLVTHSTGFMPIDLSPMNDERRRKVRGDYLAIFRTLFQGDLFTLSISMQHNIGTAEFGKLTRAVWYAIGHHILTARHATTMTDEGTPYHFMRMRHTREERRMFEAAITHANAPGNAPSLKKVIDSAVASCVVSVTSTCTKM